MPPEKKTQAESRYALLTIRSDTPPAEAHSDDETKPKNYATFLREKDRVLGPDGFVDSKSVQYQYMKKQEALRRQQEEQEYKPSTSNAARRKAVSAFQLSADNSREQKNYDSLLRALENRVVQKKQEERELKRQQGDIKKIEQAMRKESQEVSKDISTKTASEERRRAEINEKTAEVQRQHTFGKEKTTKQRIESNMYSEMEHKDTGRKVQLAATDLSRKFRAKLTELEERQNEAQRISEEYERKLRAKEEMQNQLKRELNDLALALNMEIQKGQDKEEAFNSKKKRETQQRQDDDRGKEVTLDDDVKTMESDYKTVNRSLRHLSAELTLTRAHMQMRQREETRHKQDTQIKLRQNQAQQNHLSDAAYKAELDRKGKESQDNVQKYVARKKLLTTQQWHEKKEKSEQSEAENFAKFQQRSADVRTLEHEDDLKHFQKAVERGEMMERSLFEKAKTAEHTRQKQSQTIRQLQKTLAETRQQNALKLQSEMADITKREQELIQQIQKEKASLEKVHAQREEAYYSLLNHREKLREDRHFLGEHEREHKRLQRIGARVHSST